MWDKWDNNALGGKVRVMEKVSAVVPVHNEEKYLPYCIERLLKSQLYEVVFVLDRCTDKSKEIIESADFAFRVRVIEIRNKKWDSPTAEPFAIGLREASGDFVYSVPCDIYVDPKIFSVNWTNIDLCSFSLSEFPLYGNEKNKLMTKFREFIGIKYEKVMCKRRGLPYVTGVYGFRKSIYNDIRHRDTDAEDSDFQYRCILKGYRYKHFSSNCIHLRPISMTPRGLKYKIQIGVTQFHVSLPRAIYYTLKNMCPTYLREYLSIKASTYMSARARDSVTSSVDALVERRTRKHKS